MFHHEGTKATKATKNKFISLLFLATNKCRTTIKKQTKYQKEKLRVIVPEPGSSLVTFVSFVPLW